MRGRSIRLSILILVILAISVASLAFYEINIDIPGFPELRRGGSGPAGLKLGLDLKGGAHLVYQADVGTRTRASFPQPVNEAGVSTILTDLGLTDFEVRIADSNTVVIKTVLLDDTLRQEVKAGLEQAFGVANNFRVTDTTPPTADDMDGVISIISRRVNSFGTDEPIVQQFGDDRIIVQLPGASGSVTDVQFTEPVDIEEINALLTNRGFRDYTNDQQDDVSYRIRTQVSLSRDDQQDLRNALAVEIGAIESFRVTGGIESAKSSIGQTARLEFKERTCPDTTCITFTDTDLGLTGDDLVDAFASTAQTTGEWTVNIQFGSRGADIFSTLTQRIVGDPTKRIAVFLDDELLIAPVARGWIRNGQSQITGNFTREEARILSIQLESGRLPVPLVLIQESQVDALLGSASLERSLLAGLAGLGLVMIFMIAYYRMAGVVASLALVFYAVVLLAIFKLVPITLTLPHIGGFILSIGMAVDANVLIFERLKEELRIGRTLASSMEVGFSRAWPAIRDGNVSTIITCGVLLWFGSRLGGGLINGFALSLFIGVVVSMFTALVVSRNLLQLLAWIGLGHRVNLFSPEKIQRQSQPTGRPRTAQGGR
ncbi:MAG: protein translocase subunit SecD [Chloroflexi bacterium]|nr:protein translocase subunit SecD [Chloroflexota bacterium]MDA1218113.1 protein translocase subunit SecD [Chloroflexota bacterium]PKB57890.1 MAG: protein-export membrane protein SecD [SAR202 cluster bacterium Casp-Chloro-G3]